VSAGGKWATPATPAPVLRMEVHDWIGNRPDSKRTVVPGERIRFVSIEDDRVAFDVVAKPDGSLEIRGIDTCKISGELTDTRLQIEPHVTNVITVRKMRYER
jgi:hypothetical protein